MLHRIRRYMLWKQNFTTSSFHTYIGMGIGYVLLDKAKSASMPGGVSVSWEGKGGEGDRVSTVVYWEKHLNVFGGVLNHVLRL